MTNGMNQRKPTLATLADLLAPVSTSDFLDVLRARERLHMARPISLARKRCSRGGTSKMLGSKSPQAALDGAWAAFDFCSDARILGRFELPLANLRTPFAGSSR
jgi:hypothetical protein